MPTDPRHAPKRKRHTMTVWVGFCNDKPSIEQQEYSGARMFYAFASRSGARKHFQDVRKAKLVIHAD